LLGVTVLGFTVGPGQMSGGGQMSYVPCSDCPDGRTASKCYPKKTADRKPFYDARMNGELIERIVVAPVYYTDGSGRVRAHETGFLAR